jgi:hypothetical protein
LSQLGLPFECGKRAGQFDQPLRDARLRDRQVVVMRELSDQIEIDGIGATLPRICAIPRRYFLSNESAWVRTDVHWNATSAKLLSLRLCNCSGRCFRSNQIAWMPMRKC